MARSMTLSCLSLQSILILLLRLSQPTNYVYSHSYVLMLLSSSSNFSSWFTVSIPFIFPMFAHHDTNFLIPPLMPNVHTTNLCNKIYPTHTTHVSSFTLKRGWNTNTSKNICFSTSFHLPFLPVTIILSNHTMHLTKHIWTWATSPPDP